LVFLFIYLVFLLTSIFLVTSKHSLCWGQGENYIKCLETTRAIQASHFRCTAAFFSRFLWFTWLYKNVRVDVYQTRPRQINLLRYGRQHLRLFFLIIIITILIVFFFSGFLFIIINFFYFYSVTAQYRAWPTVLQVSRQVIFCRGSLSAPRPTPTWRTRPPIYDHWRQGGPPIPLGIR